MQYVLKAVYFVTLLYIVLVVLMVFIEILMEPIFVRDVCLLAQYVILHLLAFNVNNNII